MKHSLFATYLQYFVIKKPKIQLEILSYIKSLLNLKSSHISQIFMKNDDGIKKSCDLHTLFKIFFEKA